MLGAFGSTGRLLQAAYVLAREGVLSSIDPTPLPGSARLLLRLGQMLQKGSSNRERMAAAIDKLGPSYVKLGQFLATRPDVVGPLVAEDLAQLQDRMPPVYQGEAVHAVEHALGRPIDRLPPHRIVALGLGRKFQAASVFETLTVADCLRIARVAHETPSPIEASPILALPASARWRPSALRHCGSTTAPRCSSR